VSVSESTRRTGRAEIPPELVTRTRVAVGLSIGFTAAAGYAVGVGLGPEAALRWTAGSSVGLCVVCWHLIVHRRENRQQTGETVAPTLGVANAVTFARGVLAAWIAGFALLPSWPVGPLAWAPSICYGVAVAADAVDGAIARARGRETLLGKRLDVEYDAFGLLVAPVAGAVAGVVPWPYLAVGVARYAFVAGIALRRRRERPVFELPQRSSRRLLAGIQMAYVAGALAPIAPRHLVAVGAVLAGAPLLFGFVRDWLYVTGRRAERRAR
jgi:CDP-diacylglycerol--glycerol-3-phosphate 3-phosphatidyltransferase